MPTPSSNHKRGEGGKTGLGDAGGGAQEVGGERFSRGVGWGGSHEDTKRPEGRRQGKARGRGHGKEAARPRTKRPEGRRQGKARGRGHGKEAARPRESPPVCRA